MFELKEKLDGIKNDKSNPFSANVDTDQLNEELENAEKLVALDVDAAQYKVILSYYYHPTKHRFIIFQNTYLSYLSFFLYLFYPQKALQSLVSLSKRIFSKYEQYQELQRLIEESRDYILQLKKRTENEKKSNKISSEDYQQITAIIAELNKWILQREKELSEGNNDIALLSSSIQEIKDQLKKAQQQYKQITSKSSKEKKQKLNADDSFWMKLKVVVLIVIFIGLVGAALYVWRMNYERRSGRRLGKKKT